MEKLKIINIDAEKFAFDGCHKIYLLESEKDIQEAKDNGYQVKNIENLPEVWKKSCPLKFINTWSLKQIVKQFDESRIQFKIKGAILKE